MGRAPIGDAWSVVAKLVGSFGEGVAFFGVVESVWIGEIARSAVCVVGQAEQIDCILSGARLGQWDERRLGKLLAWSQCWWGVWVG